MNLSDEKRLAAICEKRVICSIERCFDDNKLFCQILNIKDNFLLLSYYYDFEFDGFKIIIKNDIDAVLCDEVTSFISEILKTEKIISTLSKVCETDLFCFNAIFKKLKTEYLYVIIECERNSEYDFFIGRIEEISDNFVKLLCFDTLGKLDKNMVEINYENITTISFGCRYVEIMSKYINWQNY